MLLGIRAWMELIVKVKQTVTGLDTPRSFQEVNVLRFREKVRAWFRLAALRTGRIYPQEIHLVLISVSG